MFHLSHSKRDKIQIRVHVYLPRVKALYKFNTKRSIDPKDWDSKKCRPKVLRVGGAKRNRNLNLTLDEYFLAVQRIKDLYGQSLTAQILKDNLDEYFYVKEVIKINTSVDHNFETYLSVWNELVPFTRQPYDCLTENEYKDLTEIFTVRGVITMEMQKRLRMTSDRVYRESC
tara:strand:- start:984 stop:1499 length:516 start_codon:yes stop_codon:yes gene_type:complete